MTADQPLVLGIETSCDETGVGLVRGTTLLADAIASSVDEHARFGGVVPEVASRAHLEAMVPTVRRGLRDRRRRAERRRRDRGHRGSGSRRCAARRRGGGEGARALARQAALRREPPRGARRGRPAPARSAARADDGAARVRRPLVAPARARRHERRRVRSAPRSTTPRARRSTRSRGVLGLPFPGGPHIDRVAKDGAIEIDFPRGLTSGRDMAAAPLRLLVQRSQDGGGALGRGARGERRAGAGGRRRGVVPGGGRRRADPQGGARLRGARRRAPRRRRRGRGELAAARAWPRSVATRRESSCACPRPGLCTDNGAMVAALGAEMVEQGAVAGLAGPPGRLVDARHAGERS